MLAHSHFRFGLRQLVRSSGNETRKVQQILSALSYFPALISICFWSDEDRNCPGNSERSNWRVGPERNRRDHSTSNRVQTDRAIRCSGSVQVSERSIQHLQSSR